jgi:hypothetical protein
LPATTACIRSLTENLAFAAAKGPRAVHKTLGELPLDAPALGRHEIVITKIIQHIIRSGRSVVSSLQDTLGSITTAGSPAAMNTNPGDFHAEDDFGCLGSALPVLHRGICRQHR